METLNRLKELQNTKQLHHVTAKTQGQYTTLYIYRKADNDFNGFEQDCSVSNWAFEIEEYKAVNKIVSGIHVGSFGRG